MPGAGPGFSEAPRRRHGRRDQGEAGEPRARRRCCSSTATRSAPTPTAPAGARRSPAPSSPRSRCSTTSRPSTPTSSSRPSPTPRRRAPSPTPTAASSGCARTSRCPRTRARAGGSSRELLAAARRRPRRRDAGGGLRAGLRGDPLLRRDRVRGDRRPGAPLAGARPRSLVDAAVASPTSRVATAVAPQAKPNAGRRSSATAVDSSSGPTATSGPARSPSATPRCGFSCRPSGSRCIRTTPKALASRTAIPSPSPPTARRSRRSSRVKSRMRPGGAFLIEGTGENNGNVLAGGEPRRIEVAKRELPPTRAATGTRTGTAGSRSSRRRCRPAESPTDDPSP